MLQLGDASHAISSGGRRTALYDLTMLDRAREHVAALHRAQQHRDGILKVPLWAQGG